MANKQVRFKKKTRGTKCRIIFVWMDPKDIIPIPHEDIVAELTKPTSG